MTPGKPVKLFWYPAEERGRKAPPTGPRYFAVLQSKSSVANQEDWSVMLEISPQVDHKHCRDAILSFVSAQAPSGSLQPGHAFYLFEGRWPVAEGVVLQSHEEEA